MRLPCEIAKEYVVKSLPQEPRPRPITLGPFGDAISCENSWTVTSKNLRCARCLSSSKQLQSYPERLGPWQSEPQNEREIREIIGTNGAKWRSYETQEMTKQNHGNIYIYIYAYIYMHVCVYIYIYIGYVSMI